MLHLSRQICNGGLRLSTHNKAFRGFASRVLGIETTCDETGIAIVDETGNIYGDALASQVALHATFKGVVPILAAREHEEALPVLLEQALADANMSLDSGEISAIAIAAGPGLTPCLHMGMNFARKLAVKHSLPFLAVNHLEAHSVVAQLTHPQLTYPFLNLLVSGGHSQLWLARDLGCYDILGTTLDDALGESYDKGSILLELEEFAGEGELVSGALLERLAQQGDPTAFELPIGLLKKPGCDFSFSGVKTRLRRWKQQLIKEGRWSDRQVRINLAASFQHALIQQVLSRINRALKWLRIHHPDLRTLVVCGGVAANKTLITAVRDTVATRGGTDFQILVPEYCGDNGVMIAYLGAKKFEQGQRDNLHTEVTPRWPVGIKIDMTTG